MGWGHKRPQRKERIEALPVTEPDNTQPLFSGLEESESTSAEQPEQRFSFQFEVGQEVKEKYQEADSLLSRKYPKGASMEQVLDELLEAYLEKNCPQRRERRRKARKDRKRGNSFPPVEIVKTGRYIPQEVRDMVWTRDGGRCCFTAPDGRRCTSRHNLQFEHIMPVAKGGDNSVKNIELLCFCHNQHRAEREYGKEHMMSFRA